MRHFQILLTLVLTIFITANPARASADRQSFFGGGVGFEVLTQNGSGTGFYLQGQGGYAFTPNLAIGLHAGFSKIGSVDIRVIDFGPFFQLTEPESGFYGRIYLDGVNASVDGGSLAHGVNGSQTGFAPGAALGILLPSAGDFHMVPEVAYHAAFLTQTVNLISATFNLVWDL
jgi:hypothetical protein